jgi:hypothetical protein
MKTNDEAFKLGMTSKKVIVKHFNMSMVSQTAVCNNCVLVSVLNKKLKYENNKNLKINET